MNADDVVCPICGHIGVWVEDDGEFLCPNCNSEFDIDEC